jgi:hypothetical protein
VDDLKAYAKHHDPLYYTQRFIDGLRDEIKAVLLVHRPSTLDTACVLAQLQEEALAASKRPTTTILLQVLRTSSEPCELLVVPKVCVIGVALSGAVITNVPS